MNIDEELVEKVAMNARLELSKEEVSKFKQDFFDVLEAFSKIKEVDTDDVEISIQPIEIKNVFRDDQKRECLSQEQALSNAKEKKDGYFKGPKIL